MQELWEKEENEKKKTNKQTNRNKTKTKNKHFMCIMQFHKKGTTLPITAQINLMLTKMSHLDGGV
jgi:hypothetical protein